MNRNGIDSFNWDNFHILINFIKNRFSYYKKNKSPIQKSNKVFKTHILKQPKSNNQNRKGKFI